MTVTVFDQYGNTVSGATVTFAVGADSSVTPATIGVTSAVSNQFGIATLPANSWTLGTTKGVNNYNLFAYLSGTATFVTFTASGLQGAGVSVAIASGQNSSATVATSVTNVLSVTVFDAFGNTVSGAIVGFATATSGGSGNADSLVLPTSVVSNSNGLATLPANSWTLGTTAGVNNNQLYVGTPPGVYYATFTASGLVDDPDDLEYAVDSDFGSTTVATAVGPLSVTVVDQYGNAVPGVTVTFAFSGNGQLSETTTNSNVNGVASVATWTLSTTVGVNSVTAYISGTSIDITFTATGTQDVPVSLTVASNDVLSATVGTSIQDDLSVTVFDQYGNTVSGATVTFAATGGGGDGSVSPSVITDDEGLATLPAGSWTLGTTKGVDNNVLFAYISGTSTAVTFTASGLQGNPVSLTVASGQDESATVGTSVQADLTVTVTLFDIYGNTVTVTHCDVYSWRSRWRRRHPERDICVGRYCGHGHVAGRFLDAGDNGRCEHLAGVHCEHFYLRNVHGQWSAR